LIEDSLIKGSSGALPMSGIDFEPNGGDPGLEDSGIDNFPIAAWLRGLGNQVCGALVFSGVSFRGFRFFGGSASFSVVFERTL
jgi:hypothetical protein